MDNTNKSLKRLKITNVKNKWSEFEIFPREDANSVFSHIENFVKSKNKFGYSKNDISIIYFENIYPHTFSMTIKKDQMSIKISGIIYDKLFQYSIEEIGKLSYLSYLSHTKVNKNHKDFLTVVKRLFDIYIEHKSGNLKNVEFLRSIYSMPDHYFNALKESAKWIRSLDRNIYIDIFFKYTGDPEYKRTADMILKLIKDKKNRPPALKEDIKVYRSFSERTLKSGIINEPLSTTLEFISNVEYAKKYNRKISKKITIKKGTFVFPILQYSSFPSESELLVQPFTFINIDKKGNISIENALDMSMIEHSTYKNPFIKIKYTNMLKNSKTDNTFIGKKTSSSRSQRAKTSDEKTSSNKPRKTRSDPSKYGI